MISSQTRPMPDPDLESRMQAGQARRLARELQQAAGESAPPSPAWREHIGFLLQVLGLLREGLTVRKIRDRAVAWKVDARSCEFQIERHPADHVLWQTWRYDVATRRLRKRAEVRVR